MASSDSNNALIRRTVVQERRVRGPGIRDDSRDALIAEYADAVTEDKGMAMMNEGEMRGVHSLTRVHVWQGGVDDEWKMLNWATKNDLFNENGESKAVLKGGSAGKKRKLGDRVMVFKKVTEEDTIVDEAKGFEYTVDDDSQDPTRDMSGSLSRYQSEYRERMRQRRKECKQRKVQKWRAETEPTTRWKPIRGSENR